MLVDHATLYTVASVVNSKSPGDVWPALFHGWIAPFGSPVNLVTDSGGEFKSFTWAKRLSVLGTQMIFKPKGSHAHVVESRIGLLKNTLERLLRQFPESQVTDVLAHSSAVINTLPGTGGFSPAQGVFGLTKTDVFEPSATDQSFLQDPSHQGAFMTALRLRVEAHCAVRRALFEGRARRILRHNAGFKQLSVRQGDFVSFFRATSKQKGAGIW